MGRGAGEHVGNGGREAGPDFGALRARLNGTPKSEGRFSSCFPALSYTHRMLGFLVCFVGGLFLSRLHLFRLPLQRLFLLPLLLHGLTQCHQCHREVQLVQPEYRSRSPAVQDQMSAVAVEDGHGDVQTHPSPVLVVWCPLAVSGSQLQLQTSTESI